MPTEWILSAQPSGLWIKMVIPGGAAATICEMPPDAAAYIAGLAAENKQLREERDELLRHKDTDQCTRYGHRWKDAFGPLGALCQCGEWIFAVHAADCRPATEEERANPSATRPLRREGATDECS